MSTTSTERSRKFRERHPGYDAEWRAKNEDKCREETRERSRAWRAANPGAQAAATRLWRQENPDKARESYRRSAVKYREKVRARNALHYALRTKEITKEPCEVCGDTNVHAHHTDYNRPLDVRWLCPTHHGEEHRL